MLYRNTNQAHVLGQFAIDFMAQKNSNITPEVYDKARLFHTDSVICGASAIASRTNAPMVLRHEAVDLYSLTRVNTSDATVTKNKRFMSKCIGSKVWSYSEKAIAANVSAVREWDSNGSNFGFNPLRE